ncbi:TPA: EpsG family protein [Streptococcus suis]|nr:EpsG family protein [Streptococcus suis]
MTEIVLLVLLLGTFTPLNILYSLLGFARDTRHWRKYFWATLIFVFVLSYNYHPVGNSDLSRYIEWIQISKNYSLFSYIEFMGDNLYVTNFLFWLAGHLEMPYLVPALTTTVVYAVTIYITCDFAERNHLLSLIPYVLVIQILLLPYITIINNVRNVFAFSLVIFAVYRDLYQKKRNLFTYLSYIISMFVHKTSLVIIGIRLLAILAGKYTILSLVIAFLIPTILSASFPYIPTISSYGSLGKILGDALLTGYRSMVSTSTWAITVMTGKYYLINRYFSYFMSGIFLLIGSGVLKKRNSLDNIKRYFYFLSLLSIITIATNVFRTPVYWRFFAAVVIASGPILVMMLKEKKIWQIKTIQIWFAILTLSLFFLVLQIYGTTHEVNYLDWIFSVVLNPVIRIFTELVFAIFRF